MCWSSYSVAFNNFSIDSHFFHRAVGLPGFVHVKNYHRDGIYTLIRVVEVGGGVCTDYGKCLRIIQVSNLLVVLIAL